MQPEKNPHSRLGIASFALSLLSPIFIIAGLANIIISMFHASTPTARALQDMVSGWSDTVIFAPLLISPMLAALAVLLGIAGLVQKKRRKIFAVLGMLISILIWLFIPIFLINLRLH